MNGVIKYNILMGTLTLQGDQTARACGLPEEMFIFQFIIEGY
jgi:hypothetical protein